MLFLFFAVSKTFSDHILNNSHLHKLFKIVTLLFIPTFYLDSSWKLIGYNHITLKEIVFLISLILVSPFLSFFLSFVSFYLIKQLYAFPHLRVSHKPIIRFNEISNHYRYIKINTKLTKNNERLLTLSSRVKSKEKAQIFFDITWHFHTYLNYNATLYFG